MSLSSREPRRFPSLVVSRTWARSSSQQFFRHFLSTLRSQMVLDLLHWNWCCQGRKRTRRYSLIAVRSASRISWPCCACACEYVIVRSPPPEPINSCSWRTARSWPNDRCERIWKEVPNEYIRFYKQSG